MTALSFDDKVFNREVSFCRVYSLESKEKLEKLFLRNRISYFIEWQDRSFLSRLLKGENQKEKTTFTILNYENTAKEFVLVANAL